jgi:hypothetical protein
MDLTFADLQKLPTTKIKELALSIGNIHGVHSMKKNQLIAAICEIKGIVDTSKVEAEKKRQQAQKDIKRLKKETQDMRKEREEKRANLSRKELSTKRIEIKKAKRQIRKLAKP